MESIEVRFFRNRAAKKNAKNRIFGIIQRSIGQISHMKLALLRKVYFHEYEEMSDMIFQLERIKLPSILKMDNEVSERVYEILCRKAEKKAKIIEERYQKGENEETVMAEIQKLDEEKDRLVASQCEMFEKKKLDEC